MNDDQINESIRLAQEAAAQVNQRRAEEAARVQKLEERKKKALELKRAAAQLPGKAVHAETAVLNFLDWRFDTFVTLWICRVLYLMAVVGSVLWWLFLALIFILAGTVNVSDEQRAAAKEKAAQEALATKHVVEISRAEGEKVLSKATLAVLEEYYPDMQLFADSEERNVSVRIVAVSSEGSTMVRVQRFDINGSASMTDADFVDIEMGKLDRVVVYLNVADYPGRILYLFLSLIGLTVFIVIIRLMLEAVVVIFKIQENTVPRRN